MLNYTNRFSNLDPELSDTKLDSVIEEANNYDLDKYMERLNDTVYEITENLNEEISNSMLETFNNNIERDIYTACINSETVLTESTREYILTEDSNSRFDKDIEKINNVVSKTINNLKAITTNHDNTIKSILKADNEKYAKYKKNLAKKDSLAEFKGIKNAKLCNTNGFSIIKDLGRLKTFDISLTINNANDWYKEASNKIDTIASTVFVRYDRFIPKDKDVNEISNYLSTDYSKTLALCCREAESKINKMLSEANVIISYIKDGKSKNNAKVNDIYRSICTVCKATNKSFSKFANLYIEKFKVDRALFLSLGSYASSKSIKNESIEYIDSNSQMLTETSDYFIDTKFNYTEIEEMCNTLSLVSIDEFSNLMESIGLEELSYFEENNTMIVYEKNTLLKLIDKIKETFADIAEAAKKFWEKVHDRFASLGDTNIAKKLSKSNISELSDDITFKTHEYFKVKELNYAKNAREYAKYISTKFKKDNIDLEAIKKEISENVFAIISGCKATSIAELKKAVRDNLTGKSIDVSKSWLLNNFNDIKKIVSNEGYTSNIIKQMANADAKLFSDISEIIDSIDEDKYTAMIEPWGKCLVEISNICHTCYTIAMDVYRHQYIEYRNIAVKIIKESK